MLNRTDPFDVARLDRARVRFTFPSLRRSRRSFLFFYPPRAAKVTEAMRLKQKQLLEVRPRPEYTPDTTFTLPVGTAMTTGCQPGS
eukprot:29339-Pelagococcus_subviridis.AAC.7